VQDGRYASQSNQCVLALVAAAGGRAADAGFGIRLNPRKSRVPNPADAGRLIVRAEEQR
jgi:hypothetical protein